MHQVPCIMDGIFCIGMRNGKTHIVGCRMALSPHPVKECHIIPREEMA